MSADLVLFGDPPPLPRLASGLFTSARGDWRTPEDLYARFVPPCFDVSDRHNGQFSALRDPWPEPWWCNPPYNRDLGQWTARMAGTGVALLPARTDTTWFHEHVLGRCRIEFIQGRLRFDGSRSNAPFPSMLCHFGHYRGGDVPSFTLAPVDAWLTAADAARLYSVKVGTVYAWASLDGWRRRGRRPKRYAWEDAQASYERRHVADVAGGLTHDQAR